MNSNKIEKDAIRYLGDYLDSGKLIDSQINTNDKGVCWDGYINYYKSDSSSKKDFMFRVSIQVKGKIVSALTSNQSFPINTVDLKAYLTEGTMFFVVQIAENGKRIFYKILLPFYVKKLLEKHKEQKTINVDLEELSKPIEEFEQEVRMFYCDSIPQINVLSLNGRPLNIKDLSKDNIRGLAFRTPKMYNGLQLFSYLSKTPVFLYAQFNNGIEWPVGEEPVSLLFRKTAKLPICVDGKQYYDDCVTELRGDEVLITIGNFLDFTFNVKTKLLGSQIKLHQSAVTLKSSIKEGEFALALVKHKSFSVANLILDVNVPDSKLAEYYNEVLPARKDLLKAFESINYYGDLVLNDLSDTDVRKTNMLIDSIIYNRKYELDINYSGIFNIDIRDLNLLVWLNKEADGKCSISNIFDDKIDIQCHSSDDITVNATIYSAISELDMWDKCDNISYDQIVPTYQRRYDSNPYFLQLANNDVLEMIKGADKLDCSNPKRSKLLYTALELSNWLISEDKNEEYQLSYKLNTYQIKRRLECLTDDDVKQLNLIIADDTAGFMAKAAAALILGNEQLFSIFFDKMTCEERKQFLDYPISNLGKKG